MCRHPLFVVVLYAALALPGSPAAAQEPCDFNKDALQFAGDALAQAGCLLRPIARYGHVEPAPVQVPATLSRLVGHLTTVSRVDLRNHLRGLRIAESDIGGGLDTPVSDRNLGYDGDPGAPYFVIHDTSTPFNPMDAPFPDDINEPGSRLNQLGIYKRVAHVFIGRDGSSRTTRDFRVGWRATKLERAGPCGHGKETRGRFLHIENVQPRRFDPAGGEGNDAAAPEEGFPLAQLDRLAIVYVAASVRAGTWLIPGFHGVIDQGCASAHDDPQNFDLTLWDSRLGALLEALGPR
ncbi:MAG: hypothetical protein ACI9W4_002554 [Rhodothermales bacterium]|jgi:hypothetical protein